MIDGSGQSEFYDEVDLPLFPFYWTMEPRKIKAYHVRALDLGNLIAVETINALPRHLPACGLVDYLPFEDCDRRAFGMLFVQFESFIKKVMLT